MTKPAPRDHAIDCFKTLLVLGMLAAHTIQLAMRTENQALLAFSRYINLVTFSGFLFSFGYVNQLAYFPKPWAEAGKRLLRNFLLTLLVYYASGLSLWLLQALAAGVPPEPRALATLLLFLRVPGYSEFLLSFAMLNLFVLCLFVPIQKVVADDRLLWAVLALCALTTCVDYSRVRGNLPGVFVGTTAFHAFPILQYFPYYLAGARLALPKKERFLLPVSLCLTAAFFIHTVRYGLPSRFPPSFLWVAGGSLFTALYFLFSRAVAGPGRTLPAPLQRMITFIGGNTLYYLLFSNILLFAYMVLGRPLESGWWGLAAYLLLLALTTLLAWGRKALMARVRRGWANQRLRR